MERGFGFKTVGMTLLNVIPFVMGPFYFFKYAKNSAFDVMIFDMTACEIDYPLYEETETAKHNSINGDEMDCEISVEILGSSKMSAHNLVKFSCKAEKKAASDVEIDRDGERFKLDERELFASLEEVGIFVIASHKYTSVAQRLSLVNAVRLFKPQSPSFIKILRSNESYGRYMYVPAKFSQKHLKGIKYMKLQDSDGKEWPVELSGNDSGFYMREGWPTFSKDQSLKEGDICVFELIKTNDTVMKVSVSHASKE